MLVLTRKPNQQLQIGTDIVITVVKVRGNTIRLGIEAPRDVRVVRSELEPKPVGDNSADGKLDNDAKLESQPDSGEAGPTAASSSTIIVAELANTSESENGSSDADRRTPPQASEPSTGAASIGQLRTSAPRAAKRSPLGSFTGVKHAKSAQAERNLEDSPLCHSPLHRAPQHNPSSRIGREALKKRALLSDRAASANPSIIALKITSRS